MLIVRPVEMNLSQMNWKLCQFTLLEYLKQDLPWWSH